MRASTLATRSMPLPQSTQMIYLLPMRLAEGTAQVYSDHFNVIAFCALVSSNNWCVLALSSLRMETTVVSILSKVVIKSFLYFPGALGPCTRTIVVCLCVWLSTRDDVVLFGMFGLPPHDSSMSPTFLAHSERMLV